MNATSRELLKIALERGYLDADVVRRVAREAKARRVAPERVLLERRLLSVRRMERLRSHLRYRVTRQGDKAYAAVAARSGLLGLTDLREALKYQKALFTRERRCIRLGSRLIELGLLTVDQDRQLRARAHKLELATPAGARKHDASSTQALALDEESRLRSRAGEQPPASYAAIEAALARVEAIRALQDDLSTSEQSLPEAELATPDSAEEFENALATLARRRVGGTPTFAAEEPPRRRRTKPAAKKKLLAIFDAA